MAKADLYDQAAKDRLAFWDEQARQLDWDTEWTQTLDWNPPFAKWFVGGKLNVAVNCVDRHVAAGNGDRVAFHWQGDPADDKRTITYADLQKLVCQAANALTELGVKAGDPVAVYMPMIPETVVDPARLRAHRRAAHGRLRRLLVGGPCQPHPRRRRTCRRDRRRAVSARRATPR